MLEILNIGINILLWSTIVFFLLLLYICAMWAKAHPERNFTIGFLVSSYFTFKFILRAFLIILIISVLWETREDVLNSINFYLLSL